MKLIKNLKYILKIDFFTNLKKNIYIFTFIKKSKCVKIRYSLPQQ